MKHTCTRLHTMNHIKAHTIHHIRATYYAPYQGYSRSFNQSGTGNKIFTLLNQALRSCVLFLLQRSATIPCHRFLQPLP
jgi:hypothetical protein